MGGSPSYTLTEDFALGMELKRAGWHCRYYPGYLAIGEAPHEVRNIFQQRSRWCKGHFQIFFSRHCPLFVSGLSPLHRVLYCSGVWSYVVGALTTPFFMAVPIVTIWGGIFPIVVSWWAALAISVQYVATTAVLYFVRTPRHLEALFFANTCNAIMWWSYLKGAWRAGVAAVGAGGLAFKTTLKGGGTLQNSALRDLWMAILTAGGLLASAIAGTVKLANGPTLRSPLAISVLWCVYGEFCFFVEERERARERETTGEGRGRVELARAHAREDKTSPLPRLGHGVHHGRNPALSLHSRPAPSPGRPVWLRLPGRPRPGGRLPHRHHRLLPGGRPCRLLAVWPLPGPL